MKNSIFQYKKIIGSLVVLAVVVLLLFTTNSNNSYATENCSTSDIRCYQNALINTANAYKYRGYNLQYDDAKMTYNNDTKKVQRTECAFSPEEATDQHVKYASCSPFLWNIYYETFVNGSKHYELGYGNSKTATSNSNHFVYMANPEKITYFNKDVAVYNIGVSGSSESFTTSNVTIKESIGGQNPTTITYNDTDSFKNYVMGKIKEYIQPGDIIGYIYAGGGGSHVVMYTGTSINTDFKVVHSYNGNSYIYSEKYDYIGKDGTVAIWNEEKLITKMFEMTDDGTKIDRTQISIIRPLNEIIGNYNLSSNAKARLDYSDLARSKLASVEEFESVNPGDDITYTIRLQNNSISDNYTGIEISDTVPEHTEFLSCTNDCTYNSITKKVTWSNVSVNKKVAKDLSITVRVKNDTTLGTIIVSDKTVAAGITLNKIETVVNKTLTKKMQEEFASKALAKEGQSYSSTISFLVDMYKEDYGVNLNISFASLFSKFFTDNGQASDGSNVYLFNKDVKNNSANLSDPYQKMYVRGLFGGRYVDVDDFSTDNELMPCRVSDGRNKTYRDYTFMIGDIVLLKDTNYSNEDYVVDENNLYLYVGDGTFLTVKEGKVFKIDSKIFRFGGVYDAVIGNTFIYNENTYTVKNLKDGNVIFNSETSSDIERPYYYRYIESLIGQDAFVVLRPSYVMSKEIKHDINLDIVSEDNDLQTYSQSKTFKIKISDTDGNLTAGTYNIKYAYGHSLSNYTCDSNNMSNATTINVSSESSTAESNPITINSGNYSRIYICNVEEITGKGNSISAKTTTVKVLKVDANKPTLELAPNDKDSELTDRSQYLKSQTIKFRLYDEYSGLKKGNYTIKYKVYAESDNKPECDDMTDSVKINVDTDGATEIKYSDPITFNSGTYRYIAWCNSEEISDTIGNIRKANTIAYDYNLKVDSVSPKSEIVDDNREKYATSQTFSIKLTEIDGSGLKTGIYKIKYKPYGKDDTKPICTDMTDYVSIVVDSDGTESAISNSVTINDGDYEYIAWCNDTEVSDVVGNIRSIGSMYSIDNIFRVSSTTPDIEETSDYELNGNFINKISSETDISNFNLNLDSKYTIKILDRDYNVKTTGYIGTGNKVQIYLGDDMIGEYITIIKGDITGDGQISISDIAKLYQGLKRKITLLDYEIEAGNIVSSNDTIKINDVTKLYCYIKGKINTLY